MIKKAQEDTKKVFEDIINGNNTEEGTQDRRRQEERLRTEIEEHMQCRGCERNLLDTGIERMATYLTSGWVDQREEMNIYGNHINWDFIETYDTAHDTEGRDAVNGYECMDCGQGLSEEQINIIQSY